MALIWSGTISIRDAKGGVTPQKFHIESPDITAIVDASDDPVDFVQQFAIYEDAVIDGQIVGIRLAIEVALPGGLKSAPLADSDVEESVLYKLRATNGAPVNLRVPTFSESLLTEGGEIISNTDTDTFLEMMISPEELPSDYGIGLSDNRGVPVNSSRGEMERFKKSKAD